MSHAPWRTPAGPQDREPEWRDYQPSWPLVLLTGFGFAAVFGGMAYLKTGNVVALEVAAMGGAFLCAYLRWVQPRMRHLRGDDPD